MLLPNAMKLVHSSPIRWISGATAFGAYAVVAAYSAEMSLPV